MTSEEKKTGPLFQVSCLAIIRTGGAMEVTLNWSEWGGMMGILHNIIQYSWFITIWLFCLLVCFLCFLWGDVGGGYILHYVISSPLSNVPRSHNYYVIVPGFNPYVSGTSIQCLNTTIKRCYGNPWAERCVHIYLVCIW